MLANTSLLLPLLMLLSLGDRSRGQDFYEGCGSPAGSGRICDNSCTNVKPRINRSLREVYLERQLFVNFVPLSDKGLQLDNICYTFFLLAGSLDDYVFYISKVYKNGTNDVRAFTITQRTLGILNIASPDCHTINDTVIGADQCGTYVNYRCYSCVNCPIVLDPQTHSVFGLSRYFQPIQPSCFQQCVQVIEANGVPPQQYMALPMRLPPQCVTRQSCVNYPTPCSDPCITQ